MEWCKKRHRIIQNIVRVIFKPYLKLKYKVDIITRDDFKEGAVILSNHVNVLDMFYVGVCYKNPIYYMSSIDLFEHAFLGKLLEYVVAPIPKEKSKKSDIASIRNCIKISKENGIICIFPEGNRTFSGKLGYVDPSIVKLIKLLKKPLVLFTIENGYGVDPRWSNKSRKGKLNFGPKHVLEYDKYKDMSNEELYDLIVKELSVNDFTYSMKFKSNKRAEYLERILYICPKCGKLHTIYSDKNVVRCNECGLEVIYNEDLSLTSNYNDFKFKNISEWYDYQLEVIKMNDYDDSLIYQDEVGLYHPRLYKNKLKLGKGNIKLYKDKVVISTNKQEYLFTFDDIEAMTLLGKKKMNIYHKGITYQVFGDKKLCLLKYVNLYYILKNKKGGIEDGFVGL
ncbi:MAG: 1-acyl-sn-glycerol-3-phosphate acyltransferase [Bacilli bacterium]|nr:1-acyl-sn-glycerol-3-phosphate acyltransferase [Bacilli bacterium]